MLKLYINAGICAALLTLNTASARAAEWTDNQIDSLARRAEITVQKSFRKVWQYREKVGLADTTRDPQRTGVIGIEHSPITTTMGYEHSKELSTEPGWASWLVKDLAKRGFWSGADVAVSFSGSFPALNIAVLAALQELKAEVRGICSIGASSYGANEPGLTWPEMERLLREEGILQIGCSAVTFGGTADKGSEFDEYAQKVALEAVKRCRLPLLDPVSLKDAVVKRLRFYDNVKDYACYINVGGGHASLGGGAIDRFNYGGWYFKPLNTKGNPPGVIDRFLEAGVPCLNILYLDQMNQSLHIVVEP